MSDKTRKGRPKSTTISVHSLNKIQALKIRLSLPDSVLTFRDITTEIYKRTRIRISVGTIYRFANGIEPKRSDIRRALGLPNEVTIHATPCPHCGEVKAVKRCPCRRKPARRAYRYTEYPVWTLSDLADLARAQPDARVVVLGVGAEWERVRVGWRR